MKNREILKDTVSMIIILVIIMQFLPAGASATETMEEEYELRILTFEDEEKDGYWSGLIPSDQYSDPMLYGNVTTEGVAYKWHDTGNTELTHTIPFNYGSYSYWGGGHAISNYASSDFENYGSYMEQLTVLSDIDTEEGLVRGGGGHDGSDNFAVHFGYKDDFGFNGTENLPALSFADGRARVIDHMYVNITTYSLSCYLGGNGLSEPLGDNDWVKIIATGYNGNKKTGSVEFCLADMGEELFVCEWTPWELSGLGTVTRVEFNMAGSSDNGYGFSQPAYFAYDDVAVRFPKPSVSDIYVTESEAENTYDYDFYISAPEITSGKAVIVFYSGDRLVGLDIKDITDGNNDVVGSIAVSEKPNRYKIMLWDGLENMAPLCKAVEENMK